MFVYRVVVDTEQFQGGWLLLRKASYSVLSGFPLSFILIIFQLQGGASHSMDPLDPPFAGICHKHLIKRKVF